MHVLTVLRGGETAERVSQGRTTTKSLWKTSSENSKAVKNYEIEEACIAVHDLFDSCLRAAAAAIYIYKYILMNDKQMLNEAKLHSCLLSCLVNIQYAATM